MSDDPPKKRKRAIDNRAQVKRKTGSKVGRPRIRTDSIGRRDVNGRPCIYKADLHDKQIYDYMQMEKAPHEVAKLFGIGDRTIYDWKKKFPSFSQYWDAGRSAMHDSALKTLSQRMKGVTIIEETERDDGGKIIKIKTKKELPPDVKAAEIVLNRHDRQNIVNSFPGQLILSLDAMHKVDPNTFDTAKSDE